MISAVHCGATGLLVDGASRVYASMPQSHGPDGARAAQWPAGAAVLNTAILLGVALLVNFVV